MENEKRIYFQMRLEKELKDEFMSFCKKKNYNSSAIVRSLIQTWLEREKAKDKK